MVEKNRYIEDFLVNGWLFPKNVYDKLDEYHKEFVKFEFGFDRSKEYYKRRLRSIKFVNMEHVLDAGCGMGQWSIALAELNKKVTGIDLSEKRVKVAKILTKEHNLNCDFYVGRLENLPFENSTFDGIFCYGVFMFTNMPTTLKEFKRVLKPNGKIYLNANTWGWYLHLIIDRGIKQCNFGIIKTAIIMILRTLLYKNSNKVVTERYLKNICNLIGVKILNLDIEGGICLLDEESDHPLSAYKPKYYGMKSIIEMIGEVIK